MKLLYRYLLSAAPLAMLLLVLVAASRVDEPRANGVEPKAVLNGLNPDSIPAGSPGFTLEVRGGFFTKASVVEWNGQPRPTEVQNDSLLRARIPAGDAAAQGSAYVAVRSSSSLSEYPGVSNAMPFRITP
ncbi:MAG TPA: hypothetical protein VN915_03610 [Elusimicrobiota bacterium]|nr:hypothetical protein [Elusimicrobiota bacterium]